MDEHNGSRSGYEWFTYSVLYANGEAFIAICTDANCYSGQLRWIHFQDISLFTHLILNFDSKTYLAVLESEKRNEKC